MLPSTFKYLCICFQVSHEITKCFSLFNKCWELSYIVVKISVSPTHEQTSAPVFLCGPSVRTNSNVLTQGFSKETKAATSTNLGHFPFLLRYSLTFHQTIKNTLGHSHTGCRRSQDREARWTGHWTFICGRMARAPRVASSNSRNWRQREPLNDSRRSARGAYGRRIWFQIQGGSNIVLVVNLDVASAVWCSCWNCVVGSEGRHSEDIAIYSMYLSVSSLHW
jgi:hypothetical protein